MSNWRTIHTCDSRLFRRLVSVFFGDSVTIIVFWVNIKTSSVFIIIVIHYSLFSRSNCCSIVSNWLSANAWNVEPARHCELSCILLHWPVLSDWSTLHPDKHTIIAEVETILKISLSKIEALSACSQAFMVDKARLWNLHSCHFWYAQCVIPTVQHVSHTSIPLPQCPPCWPPEWHHSPGCARRPVVTHPECETRVQRKSFCRLRHSSLEHSLHFTLDVINIWTILAGN